MGVATLAFLSRCGGPACCLGYPSRLRHPVERRGGLSLCPQVCCRLVEGHNNTVLRVHVEKAHPVANLEAVEAALLDNAYIEAVACRIHHCGPYTATGGGTRHQHRVNVHLVEVPDERGSKEATGPTLRNNEIVGLGTNLLDNRVTNMLMFLLSKSQHALTFLLASSVCPGGPSARAGRAGRIDDGYAPLAHAS